MGRLPDCYGDASLSFSCWRVATAMKVPSVNPGRWPGPSAFRRKELLEDLHNLAGIGVVCEAQPGWLDRNALQGTSILRVIRPGSGVSRSVTGTLKVTLIVTLIVTPLITEIVTEKVTLIIRRRNRSLFYFYFFLWICRRAGAGYPGRSATLGFAAFPAGSPGPPGCACVLRLSPVGASLGCRSTGRLSRPCVTCRQASAWTTRP